MDIVAVITHLKTTCLLFGGRVAGAAEFTETMASELRPEFFPSAYVIPLGFDVGINDESNALYLPITERLAITVEFSNVADRRGQGVTELYAPTQVALFASLLNWRDTDPEHALRGFEAAGAGILKNDRARIFYQWEFTLESLLTEVDGWIVDAPYLAEIDANSGPNDPPPPFKVVFPQP